MQDIQLLWLDQTVALQEAELPPRIGEHLHFEYNRSVPAVVQAMEQGRVHALVIEFDYPDRKGLRLIQQLRKSHPRVPVVMITLQHSEALAVWSFRTRVWDYLVKPLSAHEIDRCFGALKKLLQEISRDRPARAIAMPAQLIPEEAGAPIERTDEVPYLPALNFVDQHFRSKIRSEEVARLCNMSPYRFSRGFKEQFGMGFREYVLQHRLRQAGHMLENPHAVVSDVCYACGFNDPSYFARMFRRFFGVAPSEAVGSVALFEEGADSSQPGPKAAERHSDHWHPAETLREIS